MRAALLLIAGEVALAAGLCLSPVPWLALVSLGAQVVALGLISETGKSEADK